MNPFFDLLVNALFVFSIIFIWIMLLYQFILTVGGFLFRRKLMQEKIELVNEDVLPTVSILIPARNEEIVIKKLIENIQDFKYPREKIEIICLNDGSKDRTGAILDRLAALDKRLKIIHIPEEKSGRGKGAVLNRGLLEAANDVIAVYDADNLPERDSLYKLCLNLISNKRLAAVTGKFRAYNKDQNFLTKLINMESIAFQWIIQAGRWFFLKISFLPGTNFVIWRSVLSEVGGWDDEALTEDTELTFRIYQKGYLIKFVPTATTWEQEPARLKTWVQQRTRWARGNIYIISTYGKELLRSKPNLASLELLNFLYLYYLFIFAILFSDILFILSLFKLVNIKVIGPYWILWSLAFLLFIIEILIALSFEKEDSFKSLALAFIAYLTYTKLWVFVVLRSFYQEYIQKKDRAWAKTERFDMNLLEVKPRNKKFALPLEEDL